MYLDKYAPEKKSEIIERYERLKGKNNSIQSTIDFSFLQSDLFDRLTDEQLLRITLYPEIQSNLVENAENTSFIEAFSRMLSTDENWTIAADLMFKNLRQKEYKDLMEDLNARGLDPAYYDTLCMILTNENDFGISSREDVEKYFDSDGKRMQIIFSMLRGETSLVPSRFETLSLDDKKRLAISEYLYGMDLKRLNSFKDMYEGLLGLDLDGIDYLKDFIRNISDLESASKEELDMIASEILEGRLKPTEYLHDMHLESKAINAFKDSYNKEIFSIEGREPTMTLHGKEKGSPEIPVFRLHGDFRMLARVEGAYNGIDQTDDYAKFYDNPSILAHGNCESLIGQDQVALAKNVKGNIVVGYSNIPNNSILEAGPYDLGSTNRSLAPLHDDLGRKLRFYSTQDMIDNTRHTHNEIVMERLILDRDMNPVKLRPSYLIWVEEKKTDTFPPVFEETESTVGSTNENEQERQKARKHYFEETLKAAEQLGIPIVVINREECAEHEFSKIEEMQKMLRGEIPLPQGKSKIDIARDALVKFENNGVGLEFADTELQSKYFTFRQREELLSCIIGVLEQIPEDSYEERYEYLLGVTEIIRGESAKLFEQSVRSNIDLKKYYSEKEKEVEDMLVKYETYIGKKQDVELSIPEETRETFERDVREISSTTYYNDNKAHSIEHIEKVMLFSTVLAKNEGLSAEDTSILLAAAAFHDSFRNGNDGNGEHATRKCYKS